MRTALPTARRSLVAIIAAALAVGLLGHFGTPPSVRTPFVRTAAEQAPNPVTPGDFQGYAFDQCLTPSQNAMDTWLATSPFLGVGIYISGDSRACRNQPNLTTSWVRTQLARGWRLLPITLGPQASCNPRFPRYRDDFKITPAPGDSGKYTAARKQGNANALQSVADAQALGIVRGSTLWYDMEGFDANNRDCRESALGFLSGWVRRVKLLGYVAGVYSSAGSGIAALDRARIARRPDVRLPDRIWVARWDGKATTSTSYIREDGWRPGGRVKQYRGGHDEVWGGVRINIDSNRVELGRAKPPAETHCGGTNISLRSYPALTPPATGNGEKDPVVKAVKCLLLEKGVYQGDVNFYFTPALRKAIATWHSQRHFTAGETWTRQDWMSVLTYGRRPVQKFGTSGFYVRRLQRGLNSAALRASVPVNGSFDSATVSLLRSYQRRVDLPDNGIVAGAVWTALRTGKR